ncbi:16S rRNA (guanine(966)-N(2))-methyltransferase RsmD [Fodinibius sediminis]|uniref:16S rRNA (Guanine(966)-N(2))-methyltransferase RsmD n=1 Tax=Fodinibius sediminis TaxID=1214077 RepID=A0A521AGY5_9BACT|nr:16S rRNA (guanine(966)-N(2))-methyltransferase RsmD [Fodinibius sediminis]SMO33998.1 16S rRNA (guanine(966)-N(2))-methyltransferase RsmD [Fodinibius sediminis]
MRIITGILKGRKIHIPKTLDVRPTTDRTKEGLFSILDARKYIRGARVLDLFGGSGNLGFEALSRGCESVLFVDSDRRNIEHIEKVAEEFGLSDQVRTVPSRVEDFLKGMPLPYDIIFADPPYDYSLMHEMIETILSDGWLDENGWLILEHDKRHDFSGHPHCAYVKEYGRTHLSIFLAEEGIQF